MKFGLHEADEIVFLKAVIAFESFEKVSSFFFFIKATDVQTNDFNHLGYFCFLFLKFLSWPLEEEEEEETEGSTWTKGTSLLSNWKGGRGFSEKAA